MSGTHLKKTIQGFAAALFLLWASYGWAATVLINGVPITGLAASTGGELRFTLEVPAGASGLGFHLNGGSGDADLYVKFSSAPTLGTYDCRPYLDGNNETCAMPTATAGTWHVLVYGYSAFTDVSLVGSYTRSSGGWNEVAKLLASDGAAYDYFGISVALSNDTALIGAFWDDDLGMDSGSAYVFTRDVTGTWSQQAKLHASNGAARDWFGYAVALSNDTALIGAVRDEDLGTSSGSVYVFTRDATGTWSQQAKLLAGDGDANDWFGNAVALSNDTALIGAVQDDYLGSLSGSAYVFTRNATGTWSQQVKLLAGDGDANDWFGDAVALNNDTALIGASGDDDLGTYSGSAYVFTRDATGTWSQQAKLLASDGVANDWFGDAVALSNDTALIGAHWDNDVSGSAYVFTRDATGTWSQQAKLLASDGAASDRFGNAVALSNDTALIGAVQVDDLGMDSGSAYVFELSSSAVGVLDNRVPVTGLAATTGGELRFTLEVPAGASGLNFQLSGGTGDADLYVKYGSAPTLDSYDCRPYIDGNEEACVMPTATEGAWHVLVRGYTDFSGVSLVGSYTVTGPPVALTNGVPVTGLAAPTGGELRFTLEVPAGTYGLNFQVSGGTGDADLYVQYGSDPTLDSFDCRPYIDGNDETCNPPTATTGTWHIMVRGYSEFADVSLVGSYSN